MKNGIQKITQNVKVTSGFTKLATMNSTTITGTISPSDATGYVVLMNGDKPIMVDASTPKTAPISAGAFTMKWTPLVPGTYNLSIAYPGDTSKCQAAAKSCGFTPAASATTKTDIKKGSTDSNNPVPDSVETVSAGARVSPANQLTSATDASASSTDESGTEARISSSGDSGVTLKQKSAKIPAGLSVNCPSGTVPLHAELFGANTGRSLKYSQTGVSLKPGAVAKGRKASIQLLCREKNHSLKPSNRLGLGTAGADQMHTKAIDGTLMGGPGKDRLKVSNRRGVAHGGLGDDKITVKRNGGVATGGPGADVIKSKTSGRSLLVGGPGRDRIVTSVGNTLVDAKDGRRDKVVCKGSNSHVRADARDELVGHCHRV